MRRLTIGLGVSAVLLLAIAYWWPRKQAPSGEPTPTPETVEAKPAVRDTTSPPPKLAMATDPGTVVHSDTGTQDEPFLRRLHKLEGIDPALAVSLALQDRQRAPNGPEAEERDMVLVAALYNTRDIPAAKREAWYYFMHYPNGRFTRYLSDLTGLVPPKSLPPK